MIAVGTQQGIWMGVEGDTNSIKLVLSISDVTQLAVLEEHRILLILAGNKKTGGGKKCLKSIR